MNFFQNEIDVFSVNLDIVKNKTDISSNVKHNKKNVFSIFNSFITLNFSKKVYETIHFLKFLNSQNIFVWDISVHTAKEIKNKIFKKKFYKQNYVLDLEGYKFLIPIHRISTYLIIIDFIEEFIGIDELIEYQANLEKVNSELDIKKIINNINKSIYKEISSKSPNSHSKKIAESLFNNVIKLMRLKSFKSLDKDLSDEEFFNSISFKEIDDDMIIDLWKIYSVDDSEIQIKSFKKIFHETIKLIHSLFINSSNLKNVVNTLQKSEGVRKTISDVKEKEYFINDIFEKYVCSTLENEIKFCNKLNENKINLIKKNEINLLSSLSNFDYHLSHLKLSFFRNLVFSGIQNQIIEGERRGSKNKIFKKIQDLKNDNLYRIQNEIIEKIKINCNVIFKILFLDLWDKSEYVCLNYMEEILNLKEKEFYKGILKKLQDNSELRYNNHFKKIELIKDFDYNKTFLIIKRKILLENKENFNEFNKFLKLKKQLKSSFRRQGLRQQDPEIPTKLISDINNNILKIRNFIVQFIDNNNGSEIISNFDNDFQFFNNSFRTIHKIG